MKNPLADARGFHEKATPCQGENVGVSGGLPPGGVCGSASCARSAPSPGLRGIPPAWPKAPFPSSQRYLQNGGKLSRARRFCAACEKEYAQKMENLATVRDGSTGELHKGYWLCDVTGAEVNGSEIVPLYQKLYSAEAKDF